MDAPNPVKLRPIEEIPVIPYKDDRYPPLLRQAFQPPQQLYVRGNVDALVHANPVAFVGTRKASSYGHTAAQMLAGPAARGGICIVSGLALGIDAVCHQAALDVGGCTIAVLAGGLDDANVGPSSNFGLAMRIIKSGGALISEYPPGTPSLKFGFPRRNRIIAGISRGTVVIEAARRSGALITARLATEINRDLYIVPGQITSPSSQGANDWLRQGAAPLLDAEQLLEACGLVTIAAARPSDHREAAILDCIVTAPKTIDELAEETLIALPDILAAVTALSLKNLITEHRGRFIKN